MNRITDVETVNGWFEDTDFSGFLEDERNVCLAEGGGGAFFLWHSPQTYEVHVAFEQRGREVIELSHRMLAWMREHMGATRFIAAIPADASKQSRKVRLFARLMGWKHQGNAALPHGECQLFIGE